MESEIVELDSRLPSLGAVLRRARIPELRATSRVVTFGGGQSLAWADNGAVLLLDTFSSEVRRFTLPGISFGEIVGTDGNARLVVLGRQGQQGGVLVADARSGRVHLAVDLGAAEIGPVVYASDNDVLFVARWKTTPIRNSVFDRIDVYHLASGVRIKTLDVSAAYRDESSPWGSWISVNASGTRLFVSTFGGGTFAFDVTTGQLLASDSDLLVSAKALDELRNRFIVGGAGAIAAFSADSLTFLGKASVPSLPLPPPGETSGTRAGGDTNVSGLSATIFALESLFTRFAQSSPCWSQLHALHADTGQVRRTVSMTSILGDGACNEITPAELIRITEPAPPPAPTANVSGHHVTLTWRAPFGTTRYEVEAGSAPGLANITTIRVADPHLVVDGVPTGTYHVRVRAINTIGKSGASQEVQVVVP